LSKFILLAGLVGLFIVAPNASGGSGGGDSLFPYPVHTEKLDNGLTVVLIPMSSNGLVSYWTIVRVGARDEYEPGHSGFAHFFEHMMFRGTEKYPAEVYNAKVTEMGAGTNASTWEDRTIYYLDIAGEDLETAMDLESDRFLSLDYPEEDFKTEAGAVYGEYRKNRTSPFFSLFEAIRDKAFTTHPYGHTVIGYEADIQAMPTMYEYSRGFFSRYYRPENCVLLIVGDFDVASTFAKVKKYYGSWQPGYVPPTVPAEPEQTAERQVEVTYEGRTLPILWLGYKVDAFDAESRSMAALNLFSALAFGETSDLYRELVLEKQAVEFLSAEAPDSRDPGLMDIITRVKDPGKVHDVLSAIDRTIAHYQTELPDAERLAALKSRIRYGFLMGLETPGQVARNVIPFLALTGKVSTIDQLFATYQEVTPEDIRKAAQAYLVPTRRTVGVLKGAS